MEQADATIGTLRGQNVYGFANWLSRTLTCNLHLPPHAMADSASSKRICWLTVRHRPYTSSSTCLPASRWLSCFCRSHLLLLFCGGAPLMSPEASGLQRRRPIPCRTAMEWARWAASSTAVTRPLIMVLESSDGSQLQPATHKTCSAQDDAKGEHSGLKERSSNRGMNRDTATSSPPPQIPQVVALHSVFLI